MVLSILLDYLSDEHFSKPANPIKMLFCTNTFNILTSNIEA